MALSYGKTASDWIKLEIHTELYWNAWKCVHKTFEGILSFVFPNQKEIYTTCMAWFEHFSIYIDIKHAHDSYFYISFDKVSLRVKNRIVYCYKNGFCWTKHI